MTKILGGPGCSLSHEHTLFITISGFTWFSIPEILSPSPPIYSHRSFEAQVPISPSILLWPSPFLRFLLPLNVLKFAEHMANQQRTSIRSHHPPTHLPATVTMSSFLSTVTMDELCRHLPKTASPFIYQIPLQYFCFSFLYQFLHPSWIISISTWACCYLHIFRQTNKPLLIPLLPLAIHFFSFPLQQNSFEKVIYLHCSNFSLPILSGTHSSWAYIPNSLLKMLLLRSPRTSSLLNPVVSSHLAWPIRNVVTLMTLFYLKHLLHLVFQTPPSPVSLSRPLQSPLLVLTQLIMLLSL